MPAIRHSEEIAAGDLSGNGRIDLVYGPHILKNLGDGTFEPRTFVTEFRCARTSVADIGANGKPDIVLGPRRTLFFVHGCFWHLHPDCPAARIPPAHRPFWQAKLTRNTERDLSSKKALTKLGWRVLTVWECETKHPEKLRRRLARLLPPA